MSDSPFTRPVIRPDADILARVPGLCLGCLVHEVEVEPSRPDCQKYLDDELAPRLVARMEGEPLSRWPNLGPSRAGCKACGKDPGRYRISSEALYRRLKQGKGLYAINSVVDANNIASLETGFSLGSYTLAELRGDITFRRGLPGRHRDIAKCLPLRQTGGAFMVTGRLPYSITKPYTSLTPSAALTVSTPSSHVKGHASGRTALLSFSASTSAGFRASGLPIASQSFSGLPWSSSMRRTVTRLGLSAQERRTTASALGRSRFFIFCRNRMTWVSPRREASPLGRREASPLGRREASP